MSKAFLYFVSGKTHLIRLLVSVYSLRAIYKDGPILFFYPKDEDPYYLQLISRDLNIRAELVSFSPFKTKKNYGYVNKTVIPKLSHYEENIFLDADTLIVSDIDELWPIDDEFVITQFSNWKTSNIKKRLEKWFDIFPEIEQDSSFWKLPAINSGIYSYKRDSLLLDKWAFYVKKNPRFIADELVLQILCRDYYCRVLDDSFNFSPIYGKSLKPKIYHFHGNKHKDNPLWQSYYKQCFDNDIGNLRTILNLQLPI